MPEFDSTVRYATIDRFPGWAFGSDGSCWTCRTSVAGKYGPWRQMKQTRNKRNGYLYISRHVGGGRCVPIGVHTLILEAFAGPRPGPNYECRHFPDPSRTNNRIENLSWGTQGENNIDRRRHRASHRFNNAAPKRLTAAKVRQIRRLHKAGVPQTSIARQIDATVANVWAVVNRRSWAHVA